MQPTQQQEARADGNGNIIIQIVGDGNTVVSGYPHLALARYATPSTIDSDLERLSPYSRSIPLVGRAGALADLWQFLENPKPIQARVLIGGGGSGKTRLAIDLCEEAIAKGWAAGLVGRDEFHRFRTQQNASTWGWNKPTLLVIDYAAGLYEELSAWLNELIQKQKAPAHPLRILLLERSASADAGWFHTVFYSGGYGVVGKQKLLNPPIPVELAPLQQVSDRRALLQSLLPNQLPTDDRDFETHLMGLEWGGDPLFLMMAALEMARTGNSKVLTLGRAELALQVAGHERERITRIARAKNVDETLVHHLAACVTLAQGVAPKALLEFANTEKSAIGRDAGSSAPLVEALRMALGKQKTIEPIRPDLIGEAYIVLAMRELEDDELSMEAVQRCYAKFGDKVVESVVRCVMDFSPDEKSPLVWMEGLIQANWDNSVGLQMLDMNVPMDSVALRDIQLEIALRILELEGNEPTPERAGALNNLATALSQLGRREEALEFAQEAVSIRRTLAATRPDVFNPDLARSLNNVANRLSALGQREEALAAAQEAVELYKTLAATRPDVFKPDLATSLNNVASFLSDLGQREEALAAAQEAVELYKTLAATRPDVFKPDLATSLNNVASFLSDLGQREEALAAAQEAVELYKTLAATRPDVFKPDLAMSLSNVAGRLSDLGQREEALAAAQEAVELYKTLAATRPDVFKPDLAMSLNNVANFLSDLGQREEALAAAQEAVELYKTLAATRPDVFNPYLAGSLNNVARSLSDLGQREEALAAAQEAVSIRRTLAATRPDVFKPDLAMSLNNVARSLSDLGQREEALAAAQEAVSIRRTLAATRPDVFKPDLAMSLNNVANRLSALGKREEALAAAQEAVKLYKALAATRPDVFKPEFAKSLIVLALRYEGMNDLAKACQFANEAVSTLQASFMQRPFVHQRLMVFILQTYTRQCQAAGIPVDEGLINPLQNVLQQLQTKEQTHA